MNDESKNGGKSTAAEEAAVSDSAPNPSTPPIDAASPPNDSSEKTESSVVEAPPEAPEYFTVGDDMAEQIAADSTLPPSPEMSTANASASVELPEVATPPAEDAGESPAESPAEASGPSDVIQEQINQNEAASVAAVAKAPKVHNPAQTAVIVTLLLMVVLSALAVFAYMSSQK